MPPGTETDTSAMHYRELLLGCGWRRDRLIDPYPAYLRQAQRLYCARLVPESERWQNIVTADLNPACDPDLVMDLSQTIWNMDPPAVRRRPPGDILQELESGDLQIAESVFDEVHCYEVLEHLGRSGDYETYFAQMDEIWRMLKPGGFLCATVPSRFSIWAWGDPGHGRIISEATLIFTYRPTYEEQLGKTASSDYRGIFSGDFDIVHTQDDEKTHAFILQAVKPARKTPAEYASDGN